jgi:hypothetical protein
MDEKGRGESREMIRERRGSEGWMKEKKGGGEGSNWEGMVGNEAPPPGGEISW